MDLLQALILGVIQGLTEFLPVSSSGHLELAKAILGVNVTESLTFSIAVHGATVLSTLIVFWKDVKNLLIGVLRFKWNVETRFFIMLIVSMIPVGLVGAFLKDHVESLFNGNIFLVGLMLLVTAIILTFSMIIKRRHEKEIGFFDALIIGLAQAVAVIPGISRSGATIATGLILGKRRDEVARFSFLMVILPILGANFLDIVKGDFTSQAGVGLPALIVGFFAAFIVGFFACKWMISLVKKGKLIWFAVYCAILGFVALTTYLL